MLLGQPGAFYLGAKQRRRDFAMKRDDEYRESGLFQGHAATLGLSGDEPAALEGAYVL